MNERNTRIKHLLNAGSIPALSFELEHLRQQLQGCVEKQAELSKSFGEAMRQSSETWHDNAPAEAISYDSKVIASVAESAIKDIGRAIEFDATDTCDEITLGSIFTVEYAPGDEAMSLLVGIILDIPECVKNSLPQECGIVTLSSPLGSSVLGAKKGDVVAFNVGNRQIKVKITDFNIYSSYYNRKGKVNM